MGGHLICWLTLVLQFVLLPCQRTEVLQAPVDIVEDLKRIPDTHTNCRNPHYIKCPNVYRLSVKDEDVSWSKILPAYDQSLAVLYPTLYDSPKMLKKDFTDPQIFIDDEATHAYHFDPVVVGFQPHFNANIDGINRLTFLGEYKLLGGVLPINPVGRTGLRGRGYLPRWGPNHAADCIPTKWQKGHGGGIKRHKQSGLKMFKVLLILRADNGLWATVGGKLDPGETHFQAMIREALEELFQKRTLDDFEGKFKKNLIRFFNTCKVVARGYIDDSKNTDNAWLEGVFRYCHSENGNLLKGLKFNTKPDEVVEVRWFGGEEIEFLPMHATHKEVLIRVAGNLNAYLPMDRIKNNPTTGNTLEHVIEPPVPPVAPVA